MTIQEDVRMYHREPLRFGPLRCGRKGLHQGSFQKGLTGLIGVGRKKKEQPALGCPFAPVAAHARKSRRYGRKPAPERFPGPVFFAFSIFRSSFCQRDGRGPSPHLTSARRFFRRTNFCGRAQQREALDPVYRRTTPSGMYSRRVRDCGQSLQRSTIPARLIQARRKPE